MLIDHNGSGLFSIAPRITGPGNLTFSGSGNTTVTGVIAIGTARLTKSGSGNLTLSGANTYNGSTTINGGTLKLGASGSLASDSALVISDGGTFETTATTFSIGTAGLTLGVGASTAGFLNAGTITLGNGLSLDIASATPSASYDLWNFTTPTGDFSTVSLTGSGGFTGSLSLSSGIWSGSSGSYAFSLNQSSGLLSIIESAAAMYWTANGASLGGTGTWNGTNTNWSTSNASVSGTAWNPASTATFEGTAGTVTVGTISANAGLSFQTTGYTLSSGTLTLGAASDVANAITVDTGLQATINSVLAGSNGMTKAGLGTLVLGGTNTYSGGTNVNLGILQGTTSSLQGNIANNAAVVFDQSGSGTYSGNMSGIGSLTKNGSGEVTLSGLNTYSGATSINAGTLTLGSNTAIGDTSAVTITGGTLAVGTQSETVGSAAMSGGALTIGSGTLTLSNASSFIGGTVTLAGSVNSRLNATGSTTLGNVNFVYNNGSNLGDGKGLVTGGSIVVNAATTANFTNAAAGVGRIELNANTTIDVGVGGTMNVAWVVDEFGGTRSLTKNGTGSLILNAANTYSGGTTLNSGTLTLNNASAAGSGTLTLNGGTLDNTSGSAITLSTNNAQNWNGNFAFTGTKDLNLGTGAVAMNATRTITVNGGNLTVGGVISGSGYGLTKAGAGNLLLSGANTFNGPLTIDAGTVLAATNANLGTGAVTINGGSLQTSATMGITDSRTLTIGASGGSIIVNAGTTLTYNGVTAGSGHLVKDGDGTLISGGSSSNTWDGDLTINAGTFEIRKTASSGYGAIATNAAVHIAASGTLSFAEEGFDQETIGSLYGSGTVINNRGAGIRFLVNSTTDTTFSGTITEAANPLNFEKMGAGTLMLSGVNSYTGNTTITAGNLTISGGAAISDASAVILQNTAGVGFIVNSSETIGSLQGGGATGGVVSIAASQTLTVNQTSDQTFAGVISGSGGLTKTGASTLTLSAANSYTGATTINAGTLQLGNGGTTGALFISSAITVNGTLAFNRSDTFTQGTNFSPAAIGGTGSVLQAGSGTLILNASNTYSGGTVLNTGTLRLSHTGAAGSGTITQSSGASLLHLNAAGTFANAMSVYNVQASETLTLSGGITVNNALFDVDNGDTLTISGAVSGTGGVTKNGTGALILSGSNSYTGATTVNAGTLQAAAANALGSTTSVLVGNGGSFLVTEGNSINNTAGITLAGGTLALNGSFSESVGALTLSANSTIDLLGFNGTLTFAGLGFWTNNASLSITNWNGVNKYGTPVGSGVADRHVVFTNTIGLDSTLSRISFYSGSFGVGFAGTAYDFGDGEIGAVPEPETIVTAMVLLVGSGLLWLRRRMVPKRRPLQVAAMGVAAPLSRGARPPSACASS